MGDSNAVVEKSLRSVFVGNIPYEATEEKLREIFSHVGPVLSFKLMHDRESGKPKGYGFCEYKDQETALSAMRNLNSFEIGGRPLRVDNACTEKSRMEMQSLMMGPVVESPYGSEVEPSQAPEAISNAVASLPPEQMYELMRQMQVCVRSNRTEARTMLLNNPQLAYALLQAQVVMRIIDPKTAVQLLHGEPSSTNGSANPLSTASNGSAGNSSNGVEHQKPKFSSPGQGPPQGPSQGPLPQQGPPGGSRLEQGPPHNQRPPHHMAGGPPPHHRPPFQGGPHGGGPRGPPQGGRDFDHRGPPPGADHDMRMPPRGPPPRGEYDSPGRFGRDNRGPPGDFDQREHHMRNDRGRGDHRMGQRDDRDYRGPQSDPRQRMPPHHQEDFRGPPPPSGPSSQPPPSAGAGPAAGLPANLPTGLAGHDQEKASLIMQVLQLSDEQIRMLPPDQQASIMQLKEQIQQSQN